MKSHVWGPNPTDLAAKKEQKEISLSLWHACTEKKSCEDTGRRQPAP